MNYLFSVVCYMGLYAVLALSLNLVVGFSGMLSLGHAAFLSMGAYCVAIFTVFLAQWNFWLVLLLGALLVMLVAALLGAMILRLQGDYLAIASLGFAEILRSILTSTHGLSRGARGIVGVVGPNIGGKPLAYNLALLALLSWLLVLCCALVLRLLLRSRLGRAIEAVREDALAASTSGINPVIYRVLPFAVAAFFAALAGGLWAVNLTAITPDSVGHFNLSVLVLSMVVLGGLGRHLGAVLGAVLLALLPNVLLLLSIPAEVNQLIYGLLLVLMMIYRPQGLLERKAQR